MALLTFTQQQAIKPISKNNERHYAQIELDTENIYLSRILGFIFAQKVQTTPLNYVDLLDGCEFTYCDETIKHKGLRFVLAHYCYAEYVKISDVSDTFTGMVQQNRTETTHLSGGRINAIRDSSLQIADQELSIIKLYLDTEKENYPYWHCQQMHKAHSPQLIEIRRI